MRKAVTPLTFATALLAAAAAFALPASAANAPGKSLRGEIVTVDPARAALELAGGEVVLFPDTLTMEHQLANYRPGEIVDITLSAGAPVVDTGMDLWLGPDGQAHFLKVSAADPRFVAGAAIAPEMPLTGYPDE